MTRLINRRTKTFIAKTFTVFAAFVVSFVFCLADLKDTPVNADSEVVISAIGNYRVRSDSF